MADKNTGDGITRTLRRYPPELRERAIRMVLESLDRGDASGHVKVPTYGHQEVPTPRPILTTR